MYLCGLASRTTHEQERGGSYEKHPESRKTERVVSHVYIYIEIAVHVAG